MARAYDVPPAVIDAALGEFRAYWTVGGGAGKRRSHWAQRARQDVKRKHESGRLRELAAPPTEKTDTAERERIRRVRRESYERGEPISLARAKQLVADSIARGGT